MATDIRTALDPTLLAERLGLTLDDWQRRVLVERPRRGLWCAARQIGKTTTALITTLWTLLYEAPALCLIVSPSLRQSTEAFRSLMLMYHKLDNVPEARTESATRAEFVNGSRVVSLPGTEKTIRGYAGAKLIVCDEAARIEDSLMSAIRPMLGTSGGSLIMLSTPAGKRGEFFRAWSEGGPEWVKVRVPASECGRLSPEFLAEEKRELGPLRYAEEYELAFNEADEAVFSSAMIDRAFTDAVRPLWG